jgi:hypothetical protein
MENFYELLSRIPGTVYNSLPGSQVELLFRLFCDTFEEHKSVLKELETLRDVRNQKGEVLDEMGKILKEQRRGMSDEEYRVKLLIAIQSNISNGSLKVVTQMTDLLSGNADYLIRETHSVTTDTKFDGNDLFHGKRLLNPGTQTPAKFEVFFTGDTGDIDSDFYQEVIDEIKPAGVEAEITIA